MCIRDRVIGILTPTSVVCSNIYYNRLTNDEALQWLTNNGVFYQGAAGIRPVSYTHLDVYKRQVQEAGNENALNLLYLSAPGSILLIVCMIFVKLIKRKF